MSITGTGLGGTNTPSFTANSQTHVFTGAVPAGSWVIVGVGLYSSGDRTVTSVSVDGLGLTKLSALANVGNRALELWGAYSAAGLPGTPTATVTLSGLPSDGYMIIGGYLSGVAATGQFDGTNGVWRNVAGGTNWTSNAVVTTNANDGLLALAFGDGLNPGSSSSPTGGYVELVDLAYTTNQWGLVMQFLEVTSTGSYASTGTWNQPVSFADGAVIVAFKNAVTVDSSTKPGVPGQFDPQLVGGRAWF